MLTSPIDQSASESLQEKEHQIPSFPMKTALAAYRNHNAGGLRLQAVNAAMRRVQYNSVDASLVVPWAGREVYTRAIVEPHFLTKRHWWSRRMGKVYFIIVTNHFQTMRTASSNCRV